MRDIHRSGITLVIVEHIMEVIMSLASRVVVFHQGKEIARGSPREVTANPGRHRGLSRQPRRQGRRRPYADRTDGRTGDMSGPLLKIEHLEVRYGDLIGVSDVSLEVPEGSVVALLGSNGGGKTTTLNAIAGLIPVHSGSIGFRGEEIGGQSAFAIVRKGLALSPEGWRLFVQQSVENNLLLGATPLRDKARAATLLERVYEIFPKLKERRSQRAGTMSGGERQMLAVGRALMSDPKLLMLDEPSLGLAPAVVESMYETFGRLHREGLTILLAEQSIELALEVSDFATVLQVGKSVLSGTAAALAQDPQVQKAYLGTGSKRVGWVGAAKPIDPRMHCGYRFAPPILRVTLSHLRLQQQQQTIRQPLLHFAVMKRQRAGIVEDGVDQRPQHDLKAEGDGAGLGRLAALAHGPEQERGGAATWWRAPGP